MALMLPLFELPSLAGPGMAFLLVMVGMVWIKSDLIPVFRISISDVVVAQLLFLCNCFINSCRACCVVCVYAHVYAHVHIRIHTYAYMCVVRVVW